MLGQSSANDPFYHSPVIPYPVLAWEYYLSPWFIFFHGFPVSVCCWSFLWGRAGLIGHSTACHSSAARLNAWKPMSGLLVLSSTMSTIRTTLCSNSARFTPVARASVVTDAGPFPYLLYSSRNCCFEGPLAKYSSKYHNPLTHDHALRVDSLSSRYVQLQEPPVKVYFCPLPTSPIASQSLY